MFSMFHRLLVLWLLLVSCFILVVGSCGLFARFLVFLPSCLIVLITFTCAFCHSQTV